MLMLIHCASALRTGDDNRMLRAESDPYPFCAYPEIAAPALLRFRADELTLPSSRRIPLLSFD